MSHRSSSLRRLDGALTRAQTRLVKMAVTVVTASLALTMGVLIGDTNNDGVVNSADIAQTKAQSGQAVTGSNFREDLNADGNLNSGDIGLVKSKSGTALP